MFYLIDMKEDMHIVYDSKQCFITYTFHTHMEVCQRIEMELLHFVDIVNL